MGDLEGVPSARRSSFRWGPSVTGLLSLGVLLGCSGVPSVGVCQRADGSFHAAGTICRSSVGACDLSETCTGASAECPDDAFLAPGTLCRASAGGCDVAEACTGESSSCPADGLLSSNSVCRAATGDCDAEERCTGDSVMCPANELLAPTAVCRASAGECDAEERCTGDSVTCPADELLAPTSVCRASAGDCDTEERCTGGSVACPEDHLLAPTAVCRASAGDCDTEERCTGSSVACPGDVLRSSTTVCRSAAGACDATEKCTGMASACPADRFVTAGASCSEAGGTSCDGAGSCVLCSNLCQQQTQCPGVATTSISGTVFMPNGTDPLPNTLVYVPNGPLQPLPSGVQSCQPCSTLVSGAPLVSTVTDAAGHFTLTNMPVGTNIPLVIQHGKWRRQFDLPSVTACVDTVVGQQLRMPSNQTEGDLPKIAVVTGAFASLECVLLKMGISPQEFGNGSTTSTHRVQFFLADGNPGAHLDSNTPIETELWGTQASLNQYDLVFFGCQGSRYPRTPTAKQRLMDYANAGGQVIINHSALEWIYNVQPFSGTAHWNIAQANGFGTTPHPALIDTSFPQGQVLAQWLALTNPTEVAGQVTLQLLYADLDGVGPMSRLWMSAPDSMHASPVPMQYTFDTPVGLPAAQQCGRVMFNANHTIERFPYGLPFPSECSSSPLRPDERLMEFMLFEQGACR